MLLVVTHVEAKDLQTGDRDDSVCSVEDASSCKADFDSEREGYTRRCSSECVCEQIGMRAVHASPDEEHV
jgi:hypothetical protein